MVPITGRARSFLVFLGLSQKNREKMGTEQQQIYQLPKVTNAPSNQPLSYTINILYLYTYIHTYVYEIF